MTTKNEKKKRLLNGLAEQKKIMQSNAELMADVCPDLGHDLELWGAADITQTWINGIEKNYK